MISIIAICAAVAEIGAYSIRVQQPDQEWQDCNLILERDNVGETEMRNRIIIDGCSGVVIDSECFDRAPR
jgi:hypothetical protein